MSNKTRKKSSSKPTSKSPHKRVNFFPLLAVVAVAICVAVAFLVNGNGVSNESSGVVREINEVNVVVSSETQVESNVIDREVSGAVTIAAGESLVIPTADITTDASFFLVEVDGTNMEVIAVRDSTGNVRTAFNTCQVCYDSGRGYYAQSGNYLVCQNCGNRFSMDQVEIESGGCNPWPIFTENKTVTTDEISISYDFLVAAQSIFAVWKGSY